MMLQSGEKVDIVHVYEHYEGRVDGQFVVSGDTWNEVYKELEERLYNYGNS